MKSLDVAATKRKLNRFPSRPGRQLPKAYFFPLGYAQLLHQRTRHVFCKLILVAVDR
jgi:hypothetical protein